MVGVIMRRTLHYLPYFPSSSSINKTRKRGRRSCRSNTEAEICVAGSGPGNAASPLGRLPTLRTGAAQCWAVVLPPKRPADSI